MRGKIRTRWPSPGRPKPSNFTGVNCKTGPPPLRGSRGQFVLANCRAVERLRVTRLMKNGPGNYPAKFAADCRSGGCCDTRLA
jgi:hypothetical protein